MGGERDSKPGALGGLGQSDERLHITSRTNRQDDQVTHAQGNLLLWARRGCDRVCRREVGADRAAEGRSLDRDPDDADLVHADVGLLQADLDGFDIGGGAVPFGRDGLELLGKFIFEVVQPVDVFVVRVLG